MKRQGDDKRREAELTDLAAGELGRIAAWRLRREISRNADLRREWEVTQEVWGKLRALQTEPAVKRPKWPLADPNSTKRLITIGGITMNRRVAFAACAALSLCTMTAGAFVGHKWLIDPFLDTKDSQGHVWRAVGHFQGEVKMFDANNHSMGSVGTSSNERNGVMADVRIDGANFQVSGVGRHRLQSVNGTLLGYADLVPETDVERATGLAAYIKRQRVDELLPIGFGSSDQDDGSEIGFFGNNREVKWTLTGDVDAQFTRTDRQRVVYHGTATTEFSRSPEKTATVPMFSWMAGGKTQSIRGFGSSAAIVLPKGIPVRVELLRRR